MSFDREKTLATAQKHIRKGNVDRAIREYERLLDEDPRDLRSKLKLADLLVKVDRFDDALRAYEQDIQKLQNRLREARSRQTAIAARLETAEDRVEHFRRDDAIWRRVVIAREFDYLRDDFGERVRGVAD